MTKKFSASFWRALQRVAGDPEVKGVWDKGTVHFETMLHLFEDETSSEDHIAAQLKAFILREAEATEAAERDLARQHFDMTECRLLEQHDDGKVLLRRMVAGDEMAVPKAAALLDEIRRVRRELGLDD